MLTTKTDIRLPAGATGDFYYVRFEFGGMKLTRDMLLTIDDLLDDGTNQGNGTLAYKGKAGDGEVIYEIGASGGYGLGDTITLDLSGMTEPNDPDNSGGDGSAWVGVSGPGTYSVSVMVYEDLSEARDADFGARVFGDSGAVITVKGAVGGKIVGTYDVADVASEEGPFRRFVPDRMGKADSGVLATVTITFNAKLLSATSGQLATAGILADATAKASSSIAGAFAIGNHNHATAKPFMVSAEPACKSGPLGTYKTADDMKVDTYDEDGVDPDGDGPLGIPYKKGHITPAGVASIASAAGTAKITSGTAYFCVLVGEPNPNETPIPIIGGQSKGAYSLTVTPQLKGAATVNPVRPAAITSDEAGSIDRNGTTVNVSYLSTADAIRQRLVIVNRGADPAMYWMSNFQTEEGVMVDTEMLTGEVPANSRLVLRVWEAVSITGGSRASGTIDVAAPKANIDVMTVQWRTDTGNFDTTLYQSAN
jgi:hypothetical protein